MIVIREQVLRLRYLVDDAGLKALEQGFKATMAVMRLEARQASAAIRQALYAALQPLPGPLSPGAWARPATGAAQRPGAGQQAAPRAAPDLALRGFRGVVNLTLGGSPLKRIFTDIDAWTQTQARLRQAVGSDEAAVEAGRDIAQASRASGTPYADGVDTYVRTRQALQDTGRPVENAGSLAAAVALGMRLSGTPAEDRGGVVAALLRMIEQGKLGLEEYNALPRRLQQALAAGLGLDQVQLRSAAQGGIAVDRALPALQSQLPAMQAEVQTAPASLTGAVTVFNDAVQRYFGETLPGGQVALRALTGTIQLLADHIDTVIKLLALAGASIGLKALGDGLRQARAVAGGLARSLLPLARVAAVLTTIFWIGEDIVKWLGGADSTLGGWIGGVEQWRDELDMVFGALTYVKDLLGGAGQALGPWLSQFGSIAVVVYSLWPILSRVGGLIFSLASMGVPFLYRAFLYLATSVIPMLWSGLMTVGATVLSYLGSGLLFIARTLVPMLWNAFAMTPIGRIISAISMLVLALWQVWENWDAIKAFIGESWDALMAMAHDYFIGPLLEYVSAIWAFWEKLVAGVIAAFTGDWDGAIAHWQGAFNGLWTFFSGMGGRMVATVKQIGGAIQTWVLDKVKAAKNLFMKLLPGGSEDEQASVMDTPSAQDELPPEWLAITSGAMVSFVSPSVVLAPAQGAGRAPLNYHNRNEVTVNVTGMDVQTVKAGVERGLYSGSERSLAGLTRAFDVTTSVERPS